MQEIKNGIDRTHLKNDFHFLELNLDKIWSQYFSDRSFPQIKSEFYKQKFLINDGIELVPQVKVTISIDKPFQVTLEALFHVFDALNQAFSQFKYKGEFFEQKEFKESLTVLLRKGFNAEKISAFVLGTYSSQVNPDSMMPEGDAFLQQRTRGHVTQYRVINNNYAAKLAQLKKIFFKLFDGKDEKSANRYLSINDVPLKNYTRLGALLELIDYGTFESIGGDDPKIFLRLNDPRRVEKDANSGSYSNSILTGVKNRHKRSCELFEYFFTHDFSNEKRWDMIEDFFLGMSNDDLFEKYPGGVQNHMDIVGYLRDNYNYTTSSEGDSQTYNTHNADLFKPKEKEFYGSDSILAIGHQVKSIGKWIIEDPVSLHRTMMRYGITIDNENFKVLVSKLQNHHFPYYRDFMRLKLRIEFPGYDGLVQASVPYHNDPVKFYRWWKQHKNDVTMNHAEKIQLFLNVDTINPRALNKAHKALINK